MSRRQANKAHVDAKTNAGQDQTGIFRRRKTFFALAILLALSTFIVYARALKNEFNYLDDRTYVTENATVQKGLTPEGMKWAFTTVHGSNWHPLTWLSHMLDCSLYGLKPAGHHFTNLALHIINVVLLLYLLCRMTGAVWPCAFVAGAFALHPAHVESVAWVAERKDVLSTCLGLLTMIAYVRYANTEQPSITKGSDSTQRALGKYWLVVLLFAFSLMAKPMMVTLPFLLLLLDYWPLRRVARLPYLLLEKVPLLILSVASSMVTVYAQHKGGAMMTEAMLPVEARLSNAIVSYVKYLWMTVWPSGLAVYYPHPLKAHPTGLVAGAAFALLAITIVVLVMRRSRPYLLVGWFWFLGTLVPVIGLVQVGGQALADRYTYVPIIGLFIMTAWGIKSITKPAPSSAAKGEGTALRIMGVSLLALLGVCTWVQAGYWRDSVTLFQRAIDAVPDNPHAHIFMANVLVRQARVDLAVPHYAEAVRIVPNEPYNLTDYGHALLDSGNADEAARQFEEALVLLPDFADAHYFLGAARIQQGRIAEAIKDLEQALARNPSLLYAHMHLGTAYAAISQWSSAITHFQKWLAVDPRSVEALTKMSQCYVSLNKQPEALDVLQKAWDIDPKNPRPAAMMAQIAAWGGEIESAIILYDKALEIDPKYAEAANNLAEILSLHPDEHFRDGKRAVQLAEMAAGARQFKDPASLDTLAGAYAEVGRFPDAMRTIDKAIELAREANSAPFIEHLQQRRSLYAAGKPARAE